MKNFKKALVLLLIAALSIGLFCGCESTEEKMAALSGTWTMVTGDTVENAQMLVDSIELYPEEIALVDMNSLEQVKSVTFNMDGTYSFGYDVDGTMECVRDFYLRAFDAMYEGRAALSNSYEVDIANMTREEFNQFYAELYTAADFDTLIDLFVDNSYDTDSLAEPFETGTYTIKGKELMCTITGESKAESLPYEIEGNVLTLHFSNVDEVYTR